MLHLTRSRWPLPLLTAALAASASHTLADLTPYAFTIDQTKSGASGNIGFGAKTTGSLIGDWNATTNPTGTRTKPGLFGPFGSDENVPVPLSLSATLGNSIATQSSGGFGMSFDFAANAISMADYSANFLASGPVDLSAELGFLFDSFRTRAPDSIYIGGIPINIPVGQAQLTSLTGQQVGPGVGTLSPTGPGTYDFSLSFVLQVAGEVNVLGQSFALPAAPLPVVLNGQLQIGDVVALLTASQQIALENTTPIGQTLPQIPFALPTILPPGGTANLLLDLMLDELSGKVDLSLNTSAKGQIVPAPGALSLMALAGLITARRRR